MRAFLRVASVVVIAACGGTTTRVPAPPAHAIAPAPLAEPVRGAPAPVVAPPIEAAPVTPPPMTVAWARGAAGSPNFIEAVAVRADGSILLAGDDAGAGWLAKPPHGNPTASGSIVSLSATGTTEWVRTLGTAAIASVAALPDGGAIACGSFTKTLKIDGKSFGAAKGGNDIAVIALDPAGRVRWVFAAGGSGYDACTDVAVTPEGRPVIVGTYTGDLKFGEMSAHAVGDGDVFVAELETNGTPRWLATNGSSESDNAKAVAIVGSNIYVTGWFGGAITFGADQLALPTGGVTRVANPSNMFIARYGANGDLAWARSYGVAQSFDRGWAITGMSDGGAAVVGDVGGHAFVARYSADGVQRWARSARNDSAGRAVAAFPDDSLVVADYFGWPQGGHELSLVGTTRTITLTAQGSDTALARYSPSGELLAAARIAGATPHSPNDRDGSEAEIFDIARTTGGRLILAGRLWGSAMFDAGDLLVPTSLRIAVPNTNGSVVLAIDPAH